MKRSISLALAFAAVTALVGCSGDAQDASKTAAQAEKPKVVTGPNGKKFFVRDTREEFTAAPGMEHGIPAPGAKAKGDGN